MNRRRWQRATCDQQQCDKSDKENGLLHRLLRGDEQLLANAQAIGFFRGQSIVANDRFNRDIKAFGDAA